MIPVRRYLQLLIDYLRPQWPRVVLLAAVMSTGIALAVINPQILRHFLDSAVEGADTSALVPIAVLFMVVAVVHQALSVLATYLAENVGWSATNRMRSDLAAHLLRLDMGFHKSHTPGELIERVDGDVTALSNFFSQFTIHVLGNLVLMVGILALLWRENLWIGLGLTVFAAGSLAGMIKIQTIAMPVWTKVRARSAEFFGFLGEQLDGTEDIRANGATGFVLHRFTGILRKWLPDTVKAHLGWAALWSTNLAVFAVGTALVYWLGSLFLSRGTLTLGSVYLVFHYTEMMRQPMHRIRNQMEDLQKAGAAIDRVQQLFSIESRLPLGDGRMLPAGPLSVAFDAVTFSYEDGDPPTRGGDNEIVLRGVTFRLDPGRVLGVLGRTGSGKTTVARLLTRLYDPRRGEVRVGGRVLHSTDAADLRRRVGMVTQEVQLFRASVRDNLTFFDPATSDERIMEVLLELGLADWVFSLPNGLDTDLGAGGGGLSAGEAQLLAFARIFLKDPGLVILDEASSRLDPATEQLIDRAVVRLLTERTGIIIAHRLATVTRADDVLIMEGGRIAEFGERRLLVADPGSRFSRLLETGLEEVLA